MERQGNPNYLRFGDLVKIKDDFSRGWSVEGGKVSALPSSDAGKQAIVVNGDRGGYCLFIKDYGKVSLFGSSDVEFISHFNDDLLDQWEKELYYGIKK